MVLGKTWFPDKGGFPSYCTITNMIYDNDDVSVLSILPRLWFPM